MSYVLINLEYSSDYLHLKNKQNEGFIPETIRLMNANRVNAPVETSANKCLYGVKLCTASILMSFFFFYIFLELHLDIFDYI